MASTGTQAPLTGLQRCSWEPVTVCKRLKFAHLHFAVVKDSWPSKGPELLVIARTQARHLLVLGSGSESSREDLS